MLIGLLLLGMQAKAQSVKESDVPPLVKYAFEQRFKGTTDVVWSAPDALFFTANFTVGKVPYVALFQENGSWVEMDTEIKRTYLPKEVKTALAKQFSEYTVKGAEKVERFDQDTLYRVHLLRNAVLQAVQFSSTGRVLSPVTAVGHTQNSEKR